MKTKTIMLEKKMWLTSMFEQHPSKEELRGNSTMWLTSMFEPSLFIPICLIPFTPDIHLGK